MKSADHKHFYSSNVWIWVHQLLILSPPLKSQGGICLAILRPRPPCWFLNWQQHVSGNSSPPLPSPLCSELITPDSPLSFSTSFYCTAVASVSVAILTPTYIYIYLYICLSIYKATPTHTFICLATFESIDFSVLIYLY